MFCLIKQLRILIACLALIGFILGMVLNVNFEFPNKLVLMLISEGLAFVLYSRFAYEFQKRHHNRSVRFLLRAVLAFLTVYGPVNALRECRYELRRDYGEQRPGFHTKEQIYCFDVNSPVRTEDGGKSILLIYRLFRARCIITLTVCALIVVEMFLYGWSDEASGLPQDDATVEKLRNEVELGDVSVNDSEPQKIVLPDPPQAAALIT